MDGKVCGGAEWNHWCVGGQKMIVASFVATIKLFGDFFGQI